MDMIKQQFARAVAEFGAWKLVAKIDGTPALPFWWHSCIPLMENEDTMPDELSVALDGASSYSEGARTFRKHLVLEVGSEPPTSGWSGR